MDGFTLDTGVSAGSCAKCLEGGWAAMFGAAPATREASGSPPATVPASPTRRYTTTCGCASAPMWSGHRDAPVSVMSI